MKTNERMCELVIQTYAEIHSQSRKVSLAFTDMIIMRGWSVIEQACITFMYCNLLTNLFGSVLNNVHNVQAIMYSSFTRTKFELYLASQTLFVEKFHL